MKKKTIYATRIVWDTDGEKIELPSLVELPPGIVDTKCCKDWKNCENNSESVNNFLSDKYGWLVENYNIVQQ